MPVQTLYLNEVRSADALTYTWAGDGTLLFSLDCRSLGKPLTYGELLKQLYALCPWQLNHNVVIGMDSELAEVLTIYHEFDVQSNPSGSLLLVSTPPDEYFEPYAA